MDQQGNTPGSQQQTTAEPKTNEILIPKRRLRNFLLKPGLQSVLGIYTLILSTLFAVAIGSILYINFSELVESVLLLTDAREEVQTIFRDYWQGVQLYIYLLVAFYISAVWGVTVWYTHKLIGPTIAFRRHINALIDKRFSARTHLRKGDAFEIADALNRLSEDLGKKKSSGKEPGKEVEPKAVS